MKKSTLLLTGLCVSAFLLPITVFAHQDIYVKIANDTNHILQATIGNPAYGEKTRDVQADNNYGKDIHKRVHFGENDVFVTLKADANSPLKNCNITIPLTWKQGHWNSYSDRWSHKGHSFSVNPAKISTNCPDLIGITDDATHGHHLIVNYR